MKISCQTSIKTNSKLDITTHSPQAGLPAAGGAKIAMKKKVQRSSLFSISDLSSGADGSSRAEMGSETDWGR